MDKILENGMVIEENLEKIVQDIGNSTLYRNNFEIHYKHFRKFLFKISLKNLFQNIFNVF